LYSVLGKHCLNALRTGGGFGSEKAAMHFGNNCGGKRRLRRRYAAAEIMTVQLLFTSSLYM
jgi:hypothetical protein